MSELKRSALIVALESADWSGANPDNKALVQAAIIELAGVAVTQPGPLVELARVEQMAAYYEAPKGFFDWLDSVRSVQVDTPI